MKENEFIEDHLAKAREALAQLPKKYARLKREADRNIDILCEKAGIMDEVQAVRDSLEQQKTRIQTQADQLQGQIAALESIFNRYHLAPIPEGVTHMYGIDLRPLDAPTRLRVMHGQSDPSWEETIRILGGNPHPEPQPKVVTPRLELGTMPSPAESRDLREPLPVEEDEDEEWEEEEDDDEEEEEEEEEEEDENILLNKELHPEESALLEEIEALEEKVSSGDYDPDDLAHLRSLTARWKDLHEGEGD